MKSRYLGIIASIILVSACTKSADNVIEDELLVHVDRFITEANQRGVEIIPSDLDLSGYVQNIEERGVLGQCKSYSDGSQTIIVDKNYWNSINELEKEYLVFHELGHCLLDRAHSNDKFTNGSCISIMQSGLGICKKVYHENNRDEMLDELFHQ